MKYFTKIENDEIRKNCSSPYGDDTFILTLSDIANLLNGYELGVEDWDEYGTFLRLEKGDK